MPKAKTKIKLAKTHTLRLSHNWDVDNKKEAFVCTDEESLTFSVAALEHADCRGCGVEVPVKLYLEQSNRWAPKATSPLHWVINKVLNEVIAPCACVRCEIRRRNLPNYDGLTRNGIAKSA